MIDLSVYTVTITNNYKYNIFIDKIMELHGIYEAFSFTSCIRKCTETVQPHPDTETLLKAQEVYKDLQEV